MKVRIETASLDSLTIRLFDQIDEANMPWLLAAAGRLRENFGTRLVDLVPAYTTLMLQYDLTRLDDTGARALVREALHGLTRASSEAGRLHEIPVWYDPGVGPELARLAQLSGLSQAQVIARHCARVYQVFALGFAPGFAYMGLVEPALAAPRLDSPRRRVAPGSVGIAERQTAIYPLESPGGWNLIGRSPVRLFDPDSEALSLLQPGDRVRFVSIERSEFLRLGGDDRPQEHSA